MPAKGRVPARPCCAPLFVIHVRAQLNESDERRQRAWITGELQQPSGRPVQIALQSGIAINGWTSAGQSPLLATAL